MISRAEIAPLAILAEDAGHSAEKDWNDKAAIAAYREAVAAGCTAPELLIDSASGW